MLRAIQIIRDTQRGARVEKVSHKHFCLLKPDFNTFGSKKSWLRARGFQKDTFFLINWTLQTRIRPTGGHFSKVNVTRRNELLLS